jgi:threonine synthase
MKFVSTRGQAPVANLSEALRNGAAPDGGLYMLDAVPAASENLDPEAPLHEFAALLLEPYFDGDPLAAELSAICAEAFDFEVPLVTPDPEGPGLHALELFHGPTGAFKDFGARFLMGCFDRLAEGAPLNVLVATSGDTGGAVGCAAENRSSVRATILFPHGRVSPFQERQLTCWGDNVQALDVDGDFDDCQHLVKAAFADVEMASEHRLTSANSINFGRLLPQLAYNARAILQVFARTGVEPGIVVPSGNLGQGFSILLAQAMGLPVGPVVLATNANRTLKDWRDTGTYAARPSLETLANAMDVGNPSNFERVAAFGIEPEDVQVELVTDEQIRARIAADYRRSGYVWCPHSATAAEAYARLSDEQQSERPWIVAATAHPYKFADVVEPLIGAKIEPTPALAKIYERPTRKLEITADLSSLEGALRGRMAVA